MATDAEVLVMIESQRLMGRGREYVDVRLLASAMLDRAALFTLDKRLA